jgi:hypothetical protein
MSSVATSSSSRLRKQLRGHVGAFIHRKREGFAKKVLRALRHVGILASSLLSSLRWSRRSSPSGLLVVAFA